MRVRDTSEHAQQGRVESQDNLCKFLLKYTVQVALFFQLGQSVRRMNLLLHGDCQTWIVPIVVRCKVRYRRKMQLPKLEAYSLQHSGSDVRTPIKREVFEC